MTHKSEVSKYENCMPHLVEEIGNLRYDRLADFLEMLSDKIKEDGRKDFNRGRVKLANSLEKCSQNLAKAKEFIDVAWEISKPFMKDDE